MIRLGVVHQLIVELALFLTHRVVQEVIDHREIGALFQQPGRRTQIRAVVVT